MHLCNNCCRRGGHTYFGDHAEILGEIDLIVDEGIGEWI